MRVHLNAHPIWLRLDVNNIPDWKNRGLPATDYYRGIDGVVNGTHVGNVQLDKIVLLILLWNCTDDMDNQEL